jgi:hypothetical protein
MHPIGAEWLQSTPLREGDTLNRYRAGLAEIDDLLRVQTIPWRWTALGVVE